jgi:predicted glutamine amidotransferase
MCGISGYISTKQTLLKRTIIKTLGILNDDRGGDSCGIFIDGNIEYGVDKNKLFLSFIDDSKLLSSTKKASIVLTHCRKRSVGEVSEQTAQPVVIKNNAGEIDFCLMHNGTIHNASELWEKHNKTEKLPTHFTDSQIIAHVFYNYGYDDLKDYNGAAVFVIVDYRSDKNNPTILFFKGASLTAYNSSTATEERPLYFCYDNDAFVFSSLHNSLKCVSDSEILSLLPNKLCKLLDGELVVIQEYDRSKQKQHRQFGTQTYFLGYNNDETNETDDYYERYYGGKNKKATKYKKTDNFSSNAFTKIEYRESDGLVLFQGKPLYGMIKTSSFGYNTQFSNKEQWYFHGYWLKGGKRTFDFIEYLFNLNKNSCSNSKAVFVNRFTSILRKFSVLPCRDSIIDKFVTEHQYGAVKLYNGPFTLPFSALYKKMEIKNGEIDRTETISYTLFSNTFESMADEALDFILSWNEEVKLYNQYYCEK